jgi:hypothetical protein
MSSTVQALLEALYQKLSSQEPRPSADEMLALVRACLAQNQSAPPETFASSGQATPPEPGKDSGLEATLSRRTASPSGCPPTPTSAASSPG